MKLSPIMQASLDEALAVQWLKRKKIILEFMPNASENDLLLFQQVFTGGFWEGGLAAARALTCQASGTS